MSDPETTMLAEKLEPAREQLVSVRKPPEQYFPSIVLHSVSVIRQPLARPPLLMYR